MTDPNFPRRHLYAGRYMRLTPVDPGADVDELFACSHGSVERLRLWTYLPFSGPFADPAAMRGWLQHSAESSDALFLTVTAQTTGQPVGMAAFMNIVPAMRRLELGYIWYTPEVQRTPLTTETSYLMLEEAFTALHCRRVEWKCDSLNTRSCTAALRLGFRFEGIFRKHMLVNGRNRDTAWFSIIDDEWPAVRQNLERYLYSGEAGLSLRELQGVLNG